MVRVTGSIHRPRHVQVPLAVGASGDHSGGTTTVESIDSTISGPSRARPRARPSRRTTGASPRSRAPGSSTSAVALGAARARRCRGLRARRLGGASVATTESADELDRDRRPGGSRRTPRRGGRSPRSIAVSATLVDDARRHDHLLLVVLALVAHRDRAPHVGLRVAAALGREVGPGARLELAEAAPSSRPPSVRAVGQETRCAPRRRARSPRARRTPSRARARRHERRARMPIASAISQACVGAGAAERDQREAARIDALARRSRCGSALAMFSLAMRTIAEAASTRRSRGARRAARWPRARAPASSCRRPPRKKPGSRRPSTMLASVIVASSPPRP